MATGTPLEQFRGFMRTWRLSAVSTLARYETELRRLEQHSGKPFLYDTSIRLMSEDVINCLIAHPDLKPESRAMIVKAAKAWDKAGLALGWWKESSGIQELELPRGPNEPLPALEPWQAKALMKACRTSRHWRLVYLGLFTGAAVGDAERMDEQCWKPDRIVYRRAKSGLKVEVPLHPELARLKDVILADSGLPTQALKAQARWLRDRVAFDFTPHALRRTYYQRMLDKRVPIWVAGALMGHAPMGMGLREYGFIPWEQKQEAIAALDFHLDSYGSVGDSPLPRGLSESAAVPHPLSYSHSIVDWNGQKVSSTA